MLRKNERNNLVNLTLKLIKFKTIKDNLKAKEDIVDFVVNQFEKSNVYIKKIKKNGFVSVIITLKKEKNPKILLNGHLDVVSGKKNDFSPKLKNNKIYGRGSGDMKAGCAVMIEVIKYFSKQKNKPSLGLMLTTDEEIGGFNGVRYLLDEKKYRPELVIIPDGGIDLKTLIINQKGVLQIKIKAIGKSAHSARPFLGENSIDELINIYKKLRRTIPEINSRKWVNTMNLSMINGGSAINSVPEKAEMFLDFRYVKIEDREVILKEIKKITKKFEIIAEGIPFVQKINNDNIKKYIDITKNKINKKIIFYKVEGASDARHFSKYDIPTIVTKINCRNIHSDNEWVDIKEMNMFFDILIEFIGEK